VKAVRVVRNGWPIEAIEVHDIDIPEILWRRRGNIDFGVYAEVTAAGKIMEGDPVETPV